jgi:hypothetical protein
MPMPDKHSERCTTPSCVAKIAQSGEDYHSVYPASVTMLEVPGAVAQCQSCGGYWDGSSWIHRCGICKATVGAGELVGLFVSHRCLDCDRKVIEQERTQEEHCGQCRSVISCCCC